MNGQSASRRIDEETARRWIHEYARMKFGNEGLFTSVVETALFLEDLFGVTISDAEMSPERLGTVDGIVAFVQSKLVSDVGDDTMSLR